MKTACPNRWRGTGLHPSNRIVVGTLLTGLHAFFCEAFRWRMLALTMNVARINPTSPAGGTNSIQRNAPTVIARSRSPGRLWNWFDRSRWNGDRLGRPDSLRFFVAPIAPHPVFRMMARFHPSSLAQCKGPGPIEARHAPKLPYSPKIFDSSTPGG